MEILVDKYCRTCLRNFDEPKSLCNDIKTYHICPDIAYQLFSCIAKDFELSDDLPKQLCDLCYNQLTNFHAFRQMCIDSTKRFHEMLKKNELSEPTMLDLSTDGQLSLKKNPLKIEKRKLRKRKKTNTQSEEIVNSKENISEEADHGIQIRIESSTNIPHSGGSEDKVISRSNQTKKGKKHQRLDKECQSKTSKIFQCQMCPMRFFTEHRFAAHNRRIHEDLVPYPCPRDGCDRGFEHWHSLSKHLKQHEGTNRLFKCEEQECNRRYKHKATLDLHLRRFHKKGPELESFVCETCGKIFKSTAILNEHKFTHSDRSELPFACTYPKCNMRLFSNNSKLKVHLLRHAGIKKYSCPYCNIRKTTKTELRTHINYHTLERRFPCKFCPQVCNNPGNLKVHVKTVHELAKDYACRFCERKFAKPDTRKYHEMIHTGEKPHACSDCGKRFLQPAALRTHKRVHLRQQAQIEATILNFEVPEESPADNNKNFL